MIKLIYYFSFFQMRAFFLSKWTSFKKKKMKFNLQLFQHSLTSTFAASSLKDYADLKPKNIFKKYNYKSDHAICCMCDNF